MSQVQTAHCHHSLTSHTMERSPKTETLVSHFAQFLKEHIRFQHKLTVLGLVSYRVDNSVEDEYVKLDFTCYEDPNESRYWCQSVDVDYDTQDEAEDDEEEVEIINGQEESTGKATSVHMKSVRSVLHDHRSNVLEDAGISKNGSFQDECDSPTGTELCAKKSRRKPSNPQRQRCVSGEEASVGCQNVQDDAGENEVDGAMDVVPAAPLPVPVNLSGVQLPAAVQSFVGANVVISGGGGGGSNVISTPSTQQPLLASLIASLCNNNRPPQASPQPRTSVILPTVSFPQTLGSEVPQQPASVAPSATLVSNPCGGYSILLSNAQPLLNTTVANLNTESVTSCASLQPLNSNYTLTNSTTGMLGFCGNVANSTGVSTMSTSSSVNNTAVNIGLSSNVLNIINNLGGQRVVTTNTVNGLHSSMQQPSTEEQTNGDEGTTATSTPSLTSYTAHSVLRRPSFMMNRFKMRKRAAPSIAFSGGAMHRGTDSENGEEEEAPAAETSTSELNTSETEALVGGEKSYPCRYCSKVFNRNFCRERHERLHTGAKPYRCDKCGDKFIRLEDKKRHSRTFHNILLEEDTATLVNMAE